MIRPCVYSMLLSEACMATTRPTNSSHVLGLCLAVSMFLLTLQSDDRLHDASVCVARISVRFVEFCY